MFCLLVGVYVCAYVRRCVCVYVCICVSVHVVSHTSFKPSGKHKVVSVNVCMNEDVYMQLQLVCGHPLNA